MSATQQQAPSIGDQAASLLGHVAGYSGHRTIALGLRSGLVDTLAGATQGLTPEELADAAGADAFYAGVWCRSASAAGVLTREGDRYRLAPHMGTRLLDEDSPGYVGGVFLVLEQEEVFDRFEQVLHSGDRLWWDETSHTWIESVSRTGRPFYTRMVPGGLSHVPGLDDQLQAGCRIVDTSCGVGVGLVRLAEHYPACRILGVDGDPHSIELAEKRIGQAGVAGRVQLQLSPLEEMTVDDPATLVINNVSMHECRDIDRSTENIRAALEPGGWFVISDFPFPDTDDGLATVPGRIMAGIQFFEAQIDDQLLPRTAYDHLLTRHRFTDLGNAELTPVHALTWGRRAE